MTLTIFRALYITVFKTILLTLSFLHVFLSLWIFINYRLWARVHVQTIMDTITKSYLKDSEKSPTKVSLSRTKKVPLRMRAYSFSLSSASRRPPCRRPWNHFSLKCSSSCNINNNLNLCYWAWKFHTSHHPDNITLFGM